MTLLTLRLLLDGESNCSTFNIEFVLQYNYVVFYAMFSCVYIEYWYILTYIITHTSKSTDYCPNCTQKCVINYTNTMGTNRDYRARTCSQRVRSLSCFFFNSYLLNCHGMYSYCKMRSVYKTNSFN